MHSDKMPAMLISEVRGAFQGAGQPRLEIGVCLVCSKNSPDRVAQAQSGRQHSQEGAAGPEHIGTEVILRTLAFILSEPESLWENCRKNCDMSDLTF